MAFIGNSGFCAALASGAETSTKSGVRVAAAGTTISASDRAVAATDRTTFATTNRGPVAASERGATSATDRARGIVRDDVLKGTVTSTGSPFIEGKTETMPVGSKVDLVMMVNLNSQINQKGDEVFMRVACDVNGDGEKVVLPGSWYVHGLVTEVQSEKRHSQNGYIEVEFDKLVSPDGEYELPFRAKLSTRSSTLKNIARTALIDSAHIGKGALAGSLLSLQLTGVSTAISTYGISVGAGAAAGALVGGAAALRRKGKISSLYPGETLKLTTAEPIVLPGFDPAKLPSARPFVPMAGLQVTVNKYRFGKDPFGDSDARELSIDVTIKNDTRRRFKFSDLAVVNDFDQVFAPTIASGFAMLRKMIDVNGSDTSSVTFNVGGPKRKYFLVVFDHGRKSQLIRVPIN